MMYTVLELDLASYSDIAIALEEALDIRAVRTFQDQIQSFVDEGLAAVGLERDEVVLGSAGDNAILVFENAQQMHCFAARVQQACRAHNATKTTPLARRWFRMGAATGPLEIDREQRRIVGMTIVRAVRLEAAAKKGTILIDEATYEALPESVRQEYGPPRTVPGKRDELYTAYEARFIEESLIDAPPPHKTPGRRRWLGVAAVAVLLAAAALGSRYLFKESPQRQPLHGTADVRVFNPNVAERNDRSIAYPGLLPVRSGDAVRLEVHLDRPAYIYLMWIAPSGDVLPVYPWKKLNWDRREDERPLLDLVYPNESSAPAPMKPNVEGREVFLALARTSRLPNDVDLRRIVSRCAETLPVRNPESLIRFRDHTVTATVGTDRDPDFLLAESSAADPFRVVGDKLNSELIRYFEFIDGVAFASQSTTYSSDENDE